VRKGIAKSTLLHDGNPVDGENQVMNNAGILKKIGARLLSFWIIDIDSESIGNRISQVISKASFYRYVKIVSKKGEELILQPCEIWTDVRPYIYENRKLSFNIKKGSHRFGKEGAAPAF
jgi:hypothetical protein